MEERALQEGRTVHSAVRIDDIFENQLKVGVANSQDSFPGGSNGKASACHSGDPGSIPGSGRSPGEGKGNQLRYSCLENPMVGGA